MTRADAIPPSEARAWPPGWTVRIVDVTGSTNADVLECLDTLPDRSVLASGHQTDGRGRLDRRWDAPPGANLLVSLLFQDVPAVPSELTRRVGLAAVAACREVAGVEARLKWPNDVLVGAGKVAGILAQRSASGSVVVGMGLNVRWAPEGAARLGDDVDPLDVLSALLRAYDELPAVIDGAYRGALSTLGRRVRVDLPGGRAVHGRALDVERDGRLVVLDECGVSHRFDAADVVHVR